MYISEFYQRFTVISPFAVYPTDLLLILVLAYGFSPIFYSSEKFFRGKNAKTRINEYQWVKRILYFEIPILIVLLGIQVYRHALPGANTVEALTLEFAFAVIAGIIWLLLVKRIGYQYHIARAYIAKSLEEKDGIEKTRSVIKSIKYYNSYLQGRLGESITDIDEVQSKFSNFDVDKRNDTTRKISQAFESEDAIKVKQILTDVFEIKIAPTHKMQKIKNMFSERGIVVVIILPVTTIIVTLIKQ
jgi:hypothetical protein